jgi:hypothetical protein
MWLYDHASVDRHDLSFANPIWWRPLRRPRTEASARREGRRKTRVDPDRPVTEGWAKGRRQAKLARSAGASPAQVRPSKPPGSECCVRRQQCRTRSVHSGCVGCVIEPRNTLFAGGGGCPLLPNATWVVPLCEVLSTLPGSKSTSRAKGSRRNLGYPTSGQWRKCAGPHREGEEP